MTIPKAWQTKLPAKAKQVLLVVLSFSISFEQYCSVWTEAANAIIKPYLVKGSGFEYIRSL